MAQAVSLWACTTVPTVATTFTTTILLWVGSCPAQLLFYTAWERIAAEYPPAINRTTGVLQIWLK